MPGPIEDTAKADTLKTALRTVGIHRDDGLVESLARQIQIRHQDITFVVIDCIQAQPIKLFGCPNLVRIGRRAAAPAVGCPEAAPRREISP